MSFIDTFLLISSIPTMNSRGLRALPCLRPRFTLNCSDIPAPMMTLPFVCSFVAYTILTFASGTPSQRNVAITIFLDTVSNAFSRSTNPIHMLPCFSSFFSTNCLSVNNPSVVPLPFLNPCCSSPISHSIFFLIRPSNTLSSSFRT